VATGRKGTGVGGDGWCDAVELEAFRGGMMVGCGDPSRSWPRGTGGGIFRATSALPRSEARFELLSRARLRGVFGGRWAVPRSTDPTYQTLKIVKLWGEMGNSVSSRSTKHTLRDVLFR
jgi:hypothetical protein